MPVSSDARPRVLLVTHYFPAHRGGVEIVAHELARRLTPHVSLRWLAADCDPPPALPGARVEPQPAWNVCERTLGLPWPLWHPEGWRTLAAAVRETDVVHLHDFIYPSSLAARLLAWRHRKPVLITQHIGDIHYENPLLRWILRALNRSVGRLMLGSAERVVFISPKVLGQFASFTHFRTPPSHWPNGVDAASFHLVGDSTRSVLRERLGADKSTPVVLFVGRFVEKKGLRLLRELAARQPGWHWWFAGWGDSEVLHPTHWQLPQVRVWAGRSGAALAELYQAADVLVLPSHGEGYPLVVQEALACGTPVVTSADTASGGPTQPDFIHAIPHDPAAPDPDAWLNRLSDVVGAPSATRARIRAQAAAFAAAQWNWDLVANRYAACLTQLARRRSLTPDAR